MKNGYDPRIVKAFFKAHGVPQPEFEYRIYKKETNRPSRFDMAWEKQKIYLEVQGAIWKPNRGHTSGKGIRQDWLKYNNATQQGWRPLFCEPKELLTQPFLDLLKRALSN